MSDKDLEFLSGHIEKARILTCGCWVVHLAQGKLILPCKMHECSVLKAIKYRK